MEPSRDGPCAREPRGRATPRPRGQIPTPAGAREPRELRARRFRRGAVGGIEVQALQGRVAAGGRALTTAAEARPARSPAACRGSRLGSGWIDGWYVIVIRLGRGRRRPGGQASWPPAIVTGRTGVASDAARRNAPGLKGW